MVKNDFRILVTACLVALFVIAADFGSFSKSIASFDLAIENFKQSENYKSYAEFKNSESSFWSKLKGTKSNSGEISDVLKDAPTSTNSEPKPEQTPAEIQKISTPVKFLLIGDSMMLEGFGPVLENTLLKHEGVSVVREGVYSTGLNRIDYYDWFTKTDELTAKHNPDFLIIMFGGNDGQKIADKDNKYYDFGTENWTETYRQRVTVYLNKFSPKVKKIYWVGHPMTANDDFANKFKTMNQIYQTECPKFSNVVYVDTWERFGVNGVYRQSIPDDNGLWQIAKRSDGVHVTEFGGGILTSLVMKEVLKDVEMK